MSWFLYGDQKVRKFRKGIWLRVRDLPTSLLDKILSVLPNEGMYSGRLKVGQIEWVEICELKEHDHALLEVWTSTHEDRMAAHSRNDMVGVKYTVFHLYVKEDPEWVCEGDLGRGYVQSRRKK